jgi:hypothetical protein
MQRSRLAIGAVLLVVLAFLAGFVPQQIESRQLARELAARELDLELANLHRQLGVATLAALRDDFDGAAAAARLFFDGCRKAVYTYDWSAEPRTRIALGAYGGQGDAILVQLAMRDPAVRERLASLYSTMNGVLERRVLSPGF